MVSAHEQPTGIPTTNAPSERSIRVNCLMFELGNRCTVDSINSMMHGGPYSLVPQESTNKRVYFGNYCVDPVSGLFAPRG